MMRGLSTDLRSGFRILSRSPGPAALAVLILAVGIGLTAAMFSIVYGVVLRGLPVDDADELMHVEVSRTEDGGRGQGATLFQFLDWRRETRTFEELHAYRPVAVYVAGQGLPERLEGARITPGVFAHLGIRPVHGRELAAADAAPGAERVALIGHRIWRERFAADPDVSGRTLRIDGRLTTVVGVMPEGFQFPERQEIWLPQPLEPGDALRSEAPAELRVFGRLADGFDAAAARADLARINHSLAEQYPESAAGLRALVEPYGRHFIGDEEVNLSWTSLGAVCFVLLIACFNVANLLLARASRRSRELAMRATLGASRWRLARQVLAEGLAVASLGAVAGLGLAQLLLQQFNHFVANEEWPFWIDIRLDWRAFLFVVAVTLVVAVIAGAIPAWKSSNLDVGAVLKDESRGSHRSRLSAALVIAEVALSCTLLVGAGLMARTLVNFAVLDFPFELDGVFAGRVSLVSADYADWETLGRSWDEIEERLDRLPGVESAAIADRVPAAEWAPLSPYEVDHRVADDPARPPRARKVRVSPGFFPTLGVRPIAGRLLQEEDRRTALPVAVVNRSFAERHWGDDEVVGRSVRFGTGESAEAWRTVVGVVPDLNAGGVSDERPEAIYVPLDQAMTRSAVILARVRGDVATEARAIRDAVASFDKDLPIYFAGALREKISQQLFFYRMVGSVFGVMAVAALLLAASGLYGLLSFVVSQRTSELGVRMALGASSRQVLHLIVGQGLRQVVVGLAVGLLLAAGVARLLRYQLFGVEPFDLPTYLIVALTLLGVGAIAAFLPALRASRVDPVEALRSE